ncbi:hypothetical protein KM043_009932 [Ampulex compressa]|nr:hypothetical protein KM043_009932 [Ampulex compressa]
MPKKKRGVDKEKKAKKKNLNERETVSYEQQILDNNKQLARLRSRNEELENDAEIVKRKLQQLEEDRSDVVAHLKRSLEEKIEETREINERLSALQELRKEELIAFKKKEEGMELEYRTMECNLSAEVKLAAGKLNALEDWRLARLDLMHKFEVQEEQIKKQEERHKRTLYEAEKSIIIGKAKMQKEMEERLKDLAESFRRATNIRIADATHRAVRENVALNQELDVMFEVCRDLEVKTKEYKDADRMLRLQASLFETEAKIILNKTIKQKSTINRLAQAHDDMNLEYGKLQRENEQLAKYDELIKDYKEKCTTMEEKIRVLEQNLQWTKSEKERILAEADDKNSQFEQLDSILQEAKNCIAEALKLEEKIPTDDVCTSCYIDLKEKLLLSLQKILERETISSIPKCSPSQMEGIECFYTKGSLGFLQSAEILRDMEISDNVEDKESTKHDKTEILEDAEIYSSAKTSYENIPSCLSSDISSEIVSPQATPSLISIIQNYWNFPKLRLRRNNQFKMVDLYGKDKGNISLPLRLQSPDEKNVKNVDDIPTIINTQKAFYEIKIADINNRIQKLEARNDELANTQKATMQLLSSIDADTAEQIANLKKLVTSEIIKINDSKKRMEEVKNGKRLEKLNHKEKTQHINEKYAATRLKLVSQIKVLNAKINVLEDYKKIQMFMQTKLKKTDETLLENDNQTKETLNQIHRKFKLDREKLKKDMYKQLLDLAGTFQIDVSDYMHQSIKRLIRENIILNNNLTLIANEGKLKVKTCANLRNRRKEYSNNKSVLYSDIRRNIIILKIQNSLTNFLKKMHGNMEQRLSKLDKPEQFVNDYYLLAIENAKRKSYKCESHVAQLETLLHKEQGKLAVILYRQKRTDCKIKNCIETLYDLKYNVKCILEKTDFWINVQISYMELISYFQDIIVKAENRMLHIAVKSVESIPRPSAVYAIGDLGFEPEHIDLTKSRYVYEKKKSVPRISKILESLRQDFSVEESTSVYDDEEEIKMKEIESSEMKSDIEEKDSIQEPLNETFESIENIEDNEPDNSIESA